LCSEVIERTYFVPVLFAFSSAKNIQKHPSFQSQKYGMPTYNGVRRPRSNANVIEILKKDSPLLCDD